MQPGEDNPLEFSPLEGEFEIVTLPVAGETPPWLRGTLFRNGPGTWEACRSRMRHWFDGLAMLHRFGFHEGEDSCANKYLRSPQYQHVQRKGCIG